MAQPAVLPPSQLKTKLDTTVENVKRMRQLLNQLREQMYKALDKPIPVRSLVRDSKNKVRARYERGSIEERLIRAKEILQTIYPDTRLAFDQTAWMVAERYRDIWNLLDGACFLVEKELGLNGPASRTRSSPCPDGTCYLVKKELGLSGPASRTRSSPCPVAPSNKESPVRKD